ncbi:similar to DNA damage repair protein Mus42 [Plenodomus lingam JN3]|uniref:DNA repair protein REV1 n=2 Tax=Leptosphaeria maculans TaxID=5022 RepID=E4ZWB3_LEPMJ|nr:similar to DNA damage repair protein Mus42 [Plenodomus lingam JN3]CBX95889.1 similar to DNA damage repair protein Mus42 [Plenodomus lingam JN3]
MQYLDGKTTVTHIIASNLTPKKVVEFQRYRIVKPAWVVDSIQAGKLLPWNEYRVVDEGDKQNVLGFDQGKVTSRSNVKTRGYRDQTEASWYTGQLQGTQAGPSSTPTPLNHVRSRFSKQRLPTPEDEIEDQPASRLSASDRLHRKAGGSSKVGKLVTPPKTSPLVAAQQQPGNPLDYHNELDGLDDSLYANPTTRHTRHRDPDADATNNEESRTTRKNSPDPKGRPLTAEEHNAILLSDPKIRKSTVVDPHFLEQYYRESRLHHLSTWKADLKSQLQALASEKSSSQQSKQKRPPGARRYVLHVDFDSFFAAVSLKKNPEYRDKPAVVAHGQGSGSEIASCNYPARKYGIRNGMWMKRALELYPDVKILPYDFPAYEEASRAFYDAILATGGLVQSVSVDEALIDVSNLCIAAGGSDGRRQSEGSTYREQSKADEIARDLREEVYAKTGCNVSVGIGSNILLAKVALRKAKPAGQHQIKPEEVLHFVGELQVQDLPGVASSIGGKLEELGMKYVKDVRELTKERLVQTLGPKTGEKLYEYARGIDRQEVGEQVVRKSVSAEVNWGVRFATQQQADEFIASLCGELQKRLLKEKVKGKQFTMKIMRRSPDAPLDPPKHLGHGKCDTHNKSLVLGVATNSKEILTKEALGILRGFGFTPGELRGIGIQMTKLEPMRSATDGSLEGSQRRLQFKTGDAKPTISATKPPTSRQLPKFVKQDPIQDDPETPRKSKTALEDEHVSFGAQQLNQSTPSRRPLNTLGTQFIMPSQVDPGVLAELPEDIRSKLLRQTKNKSPTPSSQNGYQDDPATPTKAPPFVMTALPAQSQLDPEILAALPEDVRAEVLAQYAANSVASSPSRRPRHADQTLLPQSPRKNRIIGIPAKKPMVPVKRGRGRPPKSAMLAAAAQATAVSHDGKRLTQANFISLKNPARESISRERSLEPVITDEEHDTVPIAAITASPKRPRSNHNEEELDHDFLAALPDEIRKEIIAEHKRKKLQAFRLSVTRKAKTMAAAVPPPPRPAQTIKLPRPRKPTFTTQRLSREQDLRSAVKEWIQEFADEGPYGEDVGALVKYLSKVVVEERDLAKAVGVVRWVEFVVEDLEVEGVWEGAVGRIKKGVGDAVDERGVRGKVFE